MKQSKLKVAVTGGIGSGKSAVMRILAEEGYRTFSADAIARESLASRGLDKFFTHSLGHGIGINIHEYPTISPNGTAILRDGMVFSIEPGVYFEGKFGIRVEDSVMLRGGKVESFMKSDKKLTVL